MFPSKEENDSYNQKWNTPYIDEKWNPPVMLESF